MQCYCGLISGLGIRPEYDLAGKWVIKGDIEEDDLYAELSGGFLSYQDYNIACVLVYTLWQFHKSCPSGILCC